MLKTHPLHETAQGLVNHYLGTENQLIECLQKIDALRVFEMLGFTSLFKYALSLGLSEAQAYTLIGVARKCVEVPQLQTAIESGSLSVSKARKIVSVITTDNSKTWIQKAIELPQAKLEREVACLRPELVITERVRPVCQNRIEIRAGMSAELEKRLKRVQEIVASKQRRACSLEMALEAMTENYLWHHDPMEKAKRRNAQGQRPIGHETTAKQKGFFGSESTAKQEITVAHVKLSLANENAPYRPMKNSEQFLRTVTFSKTLRNQVLLRDQSQCRHLDPHRKRCENRLWNEVHHVVPRSSGGSDSLNNLVTLCSAHHRMQHDGHGRTWLKTTNQRRHER